MKMAYMCITVLAYFLTDILNLQVLWGNEKYLLSILYEKAKNDVSLKQMYTVKNVSSKDKQIN